MSDNNKNQNKMTKVEILNRIVDLSQSSFVDENYDENNIHQLFDDMVEYAMEECEDYDVEYTEEEIVTFFQKHLAI